jgi:hypothetical protein
MNSYSMARQACRKSMSSIFRFMKTVKRELSGKKGFFLNFKKDWHCLIYTQAEADSNRKFITFTDKKGNGGAKLRYS